LNEAQAARNAGIDSGKQIGKCGTADCRQGSAELGISGHPSSTERLGVRLANEVKVTNKDLKL
jgi:hypothetical protein